MRCTKIRALPAWSGATRRAVILVASAFLSIYPGTLAVLNLADAELTWIDAPSVVALIGLGAVGISRVRGLMRGAHPG